MTPKMEFFNFGLEQKLDRHSCVKFHGESDGEGFNFPKPQLNPPKVKLSGGSDCDGFMMASNSKTVYNPVYNLLIVLDQLKQLFC